ncbi:hypothetical protein [Actinomadura madurae]|uniref:hypothetical protein n=1 Tax=Actinomadura madurae TaxID=1993 RepID=UPI0020D25D75|nr:hypothetical protein [Actinomadura madurae]MCQ0010053.1 hypothetical protein [Actinomadura madurae]
MKFSDGYWMMREGVRAFHPVEVLDVDAGPGSFRVYAPVQRIRHRGDLLRGPVVTVTCESPMPDVIGVTLTHFAGGAAARAPFRVGHRPGRGRVRGRRRGDADVRRVVGAGGAR